MLKIRTTAEFDGAETGVIVTVRGMAVDWNETGDARVVLDDYDVACTASGEAVPVDVLDGNLTLKSEVEELIADCILPRRPGAGLPAAAEAGRRPSHRGCGMTARKVHFSPFTGALAGMAACGRDLDRHSTYAGQASTAEPGKVTCAICRASRPWRDAAILAEAEAEYRAEAAA